jgi:hypothetical protein
MYPPMSIVARLRGHTLFALLLLSLPAYVRAPRAATQE